MADGINLISLEARKNAQLVKVKRQIKKAVYIFLGVFILLSVMLLGVFVYFDTVQKTNKTKVASLENQIKTLDKTESYLTIIADRVKVVNQFLKDRKSYLSLMTDLQSLLVAGFSLNELDVGTNGALAIMGKCDSWKCLTNFNDKIDQINEKKKYARISYPSVDRLADGSYTIKINME